MKRALLIWAASTALAVAQGNVSSEFKGASAAIPESGSTFSASASAPCNPHSLSRARRNLPIRARKRSPRWRFELSWQRRPFLRSGQQYCHMGREKLEH